jgi:hypothetical protein
MTPEHPLHLRILAAQSGTGDDAVMELIKATIEQMAKLPFGDLARVSPSQL